MCSPVYILHVVLILCLGHNKRTTFEASDAYPVPISGFPLRSHRNVTGRSPSNIKQEIAARIPSFSILVIDWIGIIFGGTIVMHNRNPF